MMLEQRWSVILIGAALMWSCASQQPEPAPALAPALAPAPLTSAEMPSQPQQAPEAEAEAGVEGQPARGDKGGDEVTGEPGEVAVEDTGVNRQAQPSPFAQAMQDAMLRQQPKLAECHKSHQPGSSQWADCLCQAMCEAPLKLDAPMTESVTVRWPMISAAIGVYALVYSPKGEIERCERNKRDVSETFWCQDTIESETPKP